MVILWGVVMLFPVRVCYDHLRPIQGVEGLLMCCLWCFQPRILMPLSCRNFGADEVADPFPWISG